MQSVQIADAGRASIITLMLKQVLDRNLQDPRKRDVMKDRVLTVHVRVRNMRTTLCFDTDRVRAEEGAHGRADIELEGDMQSLLAVALGASPVRALIRRKIRLRLRRLRGWLYGLRLLLLMQLGRPPFYLRWLLAGTKDPPSQGTLS